MSHVVDGVAAAGFASAIGVGVADVRTVRMRRERRMDWSRGRMAVVCIVIVGVFGDGDEVKARKRGS